MTAFWIAAWALAVLVLALPPIVTLSRVKREIRERERERRRANIRKMSTRRLLDALENPGKVSSSDWDMMIRLAVKRGVVETNRFAARYAANAKVAKEDALGEQT